MEDLTQDALPGIPLSPLPGDEDISLACYAILIKARIGLYIGMPRQMSEFGRQYMVYTEEGGSREDARDKALKFFQGHAEHRRQAVPLYKLSDGTYGGEDVLNCEDVTAPFMFVFRSPTVLTAHREHEPGSGEMGKPIRFTGKIIHRWRTRLHILTMADMRTWYHQIAFSHEPGKRY